MEPFDQPFYVHPKFMTINDLKNMIYDRFGFDPKYIRDALQVYRSSKAVRSTQDQYRVRKIQQEIKVDPDDNVIKWRTLEKGYRLLDDEGINKNSILRYRSGLPWKKERIIWIAHLKNDESCDDTLCYLSIVPKDIISYILSFFSYSKSKVDDSIWVRKNSQEAWKECVVLYDAFSAFKVHYLNYSSYYDDWIDKSDKKNISLVNPNIVVKDFKDI